MPKANLYDINGKQLGQIDLSEAVFGVKPSKASVHTVIRAHLAARRQGNQSTLTRAEVSGGGIKPRPQKGTGRARQGSTRAPQWIHGGVAFAPKPRSYRISVNRKIRRLAMMSALSAKASEQRIYVVDGLDFPEIKTKSFIKLLGALGIEGKSYVVTDEPKMNVYKSARNIPGVKTTHSGVLNVYDIVNAGVIILDKSAVAAIEEVYAR